MKIVYLHGLINNNSSEKVDWLKEEHEVYSPTMNYITYDVWNRTYENVKDFNPDLIIGSSMGGHFAIELGKRLDIPILGFNPAVHSRGSDIEIPPDTETEHRPLMYMGYGVDDVVIDYKKSIDILDGIPFKMGLHGHRTPLPFFKETFYKFTESPKFKMRLDV